MKVQLYNDNGFNVPIGYLKAKLEKIKLLKFSNIRNLKNINIFFITDKEIKKLKKKYFGINKTTDVIAFPFDKETTIPDFSLDGEIVISVDTAKKQAKSRNVLLKHELLLLVIHGLLHLSGLSDITIKQWEAMRKYEFEILIQLI